MEPSDLHTTGRFASIRFGLSRVPRSFKKLAVSRAAIFGAYCFI